MKSLAILLLLSTGFAVNGASLEKRVVAWDPSGGEPIAGVDVMASDAGRKVVFSGKSNSAGVIDIKKLEQADSVRFSILGFNPVVIAANALPDTIAMSASHYELDEVVVKASQQLVSMRGDKITYDVSKDAAIQQRSAYDALKQAPMIIVGDQGSINPVAGYVGVEYRLNGLRNSMLSSDANNFLGALKASDLKSIEVTTTPTVDGPKLIVNILTKGRIEGFQGRINSDINDSKWYNSISGLTKINNFAFSMIYVFLRNWGHDSYRDATEIRDNDPDIHEFNRHTVNGGYKSSVHQLHVKASYDFSDNTVMSLYGWMYAKANPHSAGSGHGYILNRSGLKALNYSYDQRDRQISDYEYSLVASLQSKFGGGNFYAEYELYYRPSEDESITKYDIELDPQANIQAYDSLFADTKYSTKYKLWTHTAQLEWSRSFEHNNSLKLTGKGRYISDDDQSSLTSLPITSASDVAPVVTGSDYLHQQGYGMVQGSYTMTNGPLTWRATVSGQLYSDHTDDRYNAVKYSNTFLNVLPDAYLTFKVGSRSKIDFNYYMRKNIPNAFVMSPFKNTVNPGTVRYGNPELSPETINNFNLSYMYSKGGWSLRLSSLNALSDNLILNHSFLEDGIVNQTYGNISKRFETSVTANVTCRTVSRLYLNLLASANYVKYTPYAGFEGGNHGWYGSVMVNGNYTFPYSWYVSARLNYTSRGIYFQSNGGRYLGYRLAVERGFLNNNLYVELYASNFFNKNYRRHTELFADNYYTITDSRSYYASYGLSVTWRFGKLKARVKESNRIYNGDIKNDYSE